MTAFFLPTVYCFYFILFWYGQPNIVTIYGIVCGRACKQTVDSDFIVFSSSTRQATLLAVRSFL